MTANESPDRLAELRRTDVAKQMYCMVFTALVHALWANQ